MTLMTDIYILSNTFEFYFPFHVSVGEDVVRQGSKILVVHFEMDLRKAEWGRVGRVTNVHTGAEKSPNDRKKEDNFLCKSHSTISTVAPR